MRIQKYCSEQGICSRREAEALIREGKVFVNGERVVELGFQFDPENDKLEIDGATERMTWMAFKPAGLAMDDFAPLPDGTKLPAITTLDKKNEGLVIYSNDKTVSEALTHDSVVERVFMVTTRENFHPTKANFLNKTVRDIDPRASVETKDEKTLVVRTIRPKLVDMRTLADMAHITVDSMRCISIGGLKLNNIKAGKAIKLSEKEIKRLID